MGVKSRGGKDLLVVIVENKYRVIGQNVLMANPIL